jgi:pyruvate/2-oxoglutarate dehydrogenase complex dihydrolipoamide dehydrogenase (E3) component
LQQRQRLHNLQLEVTRADSYPNKKSISIKLVADRKSQGVIGAQIVRGESVKGRIDLVAFALLMKATLDDLANYDGCYVQLHLCGNQ